MDCCAPTRAPGSALPPDRAIAPPATLERNDPAGHAKRVPQRISPGTVATLTAPTAPTIGPAQRRRMFHRSRIAPILVVTAAVVAGAWPTAAFAATQPRLGTALNFAAIAGPTVIKGNVALSPGSAITGFPPGISAVRNIADANAVKAKTDLVTAFTDAASAPSTSNLTGKNLGGLNLTAGVYSFSSSAQLTGKLTLSGTGVFIFRIGSALTTATASAVLLRNGAQACAVYWEVGSSSTLGSATQFQGNLMALTSITMVTGANIITGRAMARNGALTLDTN